MFIYRQHFLNFIILSLIYNNFCSYLPLPHGYERLLTWTFIYFGTKIAYYNGDVMKIKDDMDEI